MILLLSVLCYKIRPVCIIFLLKYPFHNLTITIPEVFKIAACYTILRYTCCIRFLQLSISHGCISGKTIIAKLVATHKIGHAGYIFRTVISVVSNRYFAHIRRRALLGCYHNNSIGGSGTENSCRRSILQNIKTLNIGRIQEVNTIGNNSINNIKRRSSLHRTLSADLNIKPPTCSTRVLGNIHPCYLSLQRFHHTGCTFCNNIVSGNATDRPRKIVLLHGSVSDNNHFIQFREIVSHNNIHHFTGDRNILSFHTNILGFENF